MIDSDQDKNILPPEFDSLLALLGEQPERVRKIWRYALVLMMIDDERAHIVDSYKEDSVQFLLIETVKGETFSVERPAMSEEVEQLLMAQVRQIVSDDSGTVN